MSAEFEYEKTVTEYLAAKNIPGLVVLTAADASDMKLKSGTKPTAVVALGDETTSTQNRPSSVIVETQIQVWLILRGAARQRTEEDTFLRDAIFQALHGELLPGLTSELEWRSTAPDYVDNARTYLMTFVAKSLKAKRYAPVGIR